MGIFIPLPQGSKLRPAGVAVEERKYCSVETAPPARNNRTAERDAGKAEGCEARTYSTRSSMGPAPQRRSKPLEVLQHSHEKTYWSSSMKAFKVKGPSGTLVNGIWPSKKAIPEKVPDAFEFYFDPEDGEIVQVIIKREEYDKIRRSSGCKDRVVEPAVAVPQYAELDAIVNGLVREVAIEINARCSSVGSYPQCPYKAQYVLEELIKKLQEKV